MKAQTLTVSLNKPRLTVTSQEVQLSCISLPGYILPTWQKGILKTVRTPWWGRVVARYLVFSSIEDINAERLVYIKHYVRVK